MINLLYSLTIAPLVACYEFLFTFLISLSNSYILALILMSLITSLVLSPLKRLAIKVQTRELLIQGILSPQIQKISSESRGAERQYRISKLYKKYRYHPLLTLRSSVGVFLQIPFLCAAYFMLSQYGQLSGESFFFIQDLSKPDASFFGINILPFVMTVANLVALYRAPKTGKNDTLQGIVVASLFLIILYNAPSALLVYWTCNNILLLFSFPPRLIRPCLPLLERTRSIFYKNLKTTSLPLCLILIVLLPFCYYLQQNWASYIAPEIIFSFLVIFSIGALAFIFSALGLEFLAYPKTSPYNKLFLAIGCLFLILAIAIVYEFTHTAIKHSRVFSRTGLYLFEIALAATLIVCVKKYSLKYINLILLATLALIGILCAQITALDSSNQVTLAASGTVKLKEKPNIFIFLIESFHGLDVQKDIYEIDQNKLDQFLTERDFTIYPEIFSNSFGTFYSTTDLFTMEDEKRFFPLISKFGVSTAQLALLGGDQNNRLFRNLKSNGYKTVFLTGGGRTDFIRKQGKYLDEKDFVSKYDHMGAALLDCNKITRRVFTFLYPESVKALLKEPNVVESLHRVLENKALSNDGTPLFVFYYGGAVHSPHINYHFSQRNKWMDSKVYQNSVTKATTQIQESVATILKYDPNALIILIGDHGAYRYRGLLEGYPVDKQALVERMASENITLKEFSDDLFNVFLAIKMPPNIKKLPPTPHLSHVNLFKNVFNALNDSVAGDSFVLDTVSEFMGYNFIRNGKPTIEELSTP